ncbi:hypothetical protein B0A55_08915 [Friedmanniomyces simplex]|uniref:beta-glucosidase n=1 Tax=Friedmanniomyces simplex TaxID=329884 RepID=A0A4U0X0Z5_9PEZI|nr:hypothetical protein B0A55_08915 [Friedmanniomyces simplex]
MANSLHFAAALLVAATTVTGQNGSTIGSGPSAAGPTWNHADFESSPPIYPSPNATGLGWSDAFQQASAFVSQLTLEEKARLVTGTPGPCVGNIGAIERLGFNGLCLQDGPLAIREATYASVFPAGLSVAASWDRDLARQRGVDMGQEFRGKGAHVALGPVAGPLGRSGYGGRNWEGFSPDPFLTGELFGMTIEGMESAGVQSCAKHFIGNEQETQRNPSGGPNGGGVGGAVEGPIIQAVSSNIDDRTMHEAYLWPFQNAVHSGVSAVMCSYNRINGSYGCQNSKTLNGLLKDELGFQGFVMSDWAATHSGWPAAEAGLDMDMPGGISFVTASPSFFGGNITASVNNGSLPIERLDDMCRRIMTPYFRLGQNTNYPPIDAAVGGLNFFPVTNYLYNFTEGPANVDVRDDHAELIRELGAAGTVLLKNINNTLPLKTPANVGVFGNDAPDISIGLYFGGDPDVLNVGYDQGVLPVGGGSGTGRMTYVVPPLEAIKSKVFSYNSKALVQYGTNNTEIISNGIFGPLIYPTPPDVCLVFLKTWSTEGYDRSSLEVDWDGSAVVETVAASCPNTVVVTHSGGLNVLPFANNPNVTAILAAHLPGQEVGNSIVDILWGAVNPSGKLPYTIALNENDYSFADITNSTALLKTTDPNAWQSDFEERLLIDYRHFDYFNETVQYEFGYGLSYTTFSMGSASVARVGSGTISAAPANNTIAPGGNPALWDMLYTVSVSVSNTGSVAGATVPQLYLGLPQPANEDYTPVKVLRGFEKVTLQPGESQTVTFSLTRRDISYWDTFAQQWIIGSSSIGVLAGFSSRDIQTTTTFTPLASSSGSGSGSPSPAPYSSSSRGSGSPSPTPSSGYGGAGGYDDHAGPWHWSSSENHPSHWGPPAAKQ